MPPIYTTTDANNRQHPLNSTKNHVIGVPEVTKLHATDNRGDRDGYENADPLPDWWMAVGREDIPKLMVVSKIDPRIEEPMLKVLAEADSYKKRREAAIEKLNARATKGGTSSLG